jgi:porin
VFSNMMAGWPILPTEDLFAGGPAYPLSSLAVRLEVAPRPDFSVQTAVFDDNPSGGPFNDDQQTLNSGGTLFNLHGGALFITEAKFSRPAAAHLPGTYKIGGWYDTGWFGDFAGGTTGRYHGNYGAYAMADQTIWAAGARTLNGIVRILGAPGDRNLIDLSVNTGMTMTEPLPGRPYDILGLEVGIAQAGKAAQGRGIETAVELTYAAQATPWLVLQPDLQYVANPGAGIENPDRPGEHVHNAWVAGLRGIVSFF